MIKSLPMMFILSEIIILSKTTTNCRIVMVLLRVALIKSPGMHPDMKFLLDLLTLIHVLQHTENII